MIDLTPLLLRHWVLNNKSSIGWNVRTLTVMERKEGSWSILVESDCCGVTWLFTVEGPWPKGLTRCFTCSCLLATTVWLPVETPIELDWREMIEIAGRLNVD